MRPHATGTFLLLSLAGACGGQGTGTTTTSSTTAAGGAGGAPTGSTTSTSTTTTDTPSGSTTDTPSVTVTTTDTGSTTTTSTTTTTSVDPCGAGQLCDGTTGLCAPIPPCSPTHPCTQPGGGTLTTPFTAPQCRTTVASHPLHDDGPPRGWTDAVNGEQRAACVHRPSGAGTHPLLVFLHGADGSAQGIYNRTRLRDKADTFNFYTLPARAGFVIAADQGRNLPGYGIYPNGKTAHDHAYRDMGSPSANPDVRNLDRLIDELVAEGGIDTARIYVVGWSNGGFFAHFYGVARHATPTPGGNKVTAVVSFASGDPFENVSATQNPSCKLAAYPQTLLPMGFVVRSCDSFVGCDAAQAQKFGLDPGYDVTAWAATVKTTMGDPSSQDLILDAAGNAVGACDAPAACSKIAGTQNHLAWPDGLDDGSGNDWEPVILEWLKAHP